MKIAIFADGANADDMLKMYREGKVKGFTTNPTLMAQAGVTEYEKFARAILAEITDLPISFEVFSDEFDEMYAQAQKIATWGDNVNIKVPITNTRGESSIALIRKLLDQDVAVNVTAVFTDEQLRALQEIATPNDDLIISIFAGRIADTGVDPIPMMKHAVAMFSSMPNIKILWASPREVLNIYQADECGCHIITATPSLINKLNLQGKDLSLFSRETVAMFYNDAQSAGLSLG